MNSILIRASLLTVALLICAGARADTPVRTEKAACTQLKRFYEQFRDAGTAKPDDGWVCEFSSESDRERYVAALRAPCDRRSGLAGWFSVAKKTGEIQPLDGMVKTGVRPATDAASPTRVGDIGYPSVKAAREALRGRTDVIESIEQDGKVLLAPVEDGWTLFIDKTSLADWSFAPPTQPAYPTAVKRYNFVFHRNRPDTYDTSVLCEADKPACDKLLSELKVRPH